MRKRWIVVTALAGVLTLGILGGTALAHSGGDSDAPASIHSRVAEILGIDDQQVLDAFQQAAQEQREARMQHRFDDLVERGVLTREQADETLAWLDARPSFSDSDAQSGRLFGRGFFRRGGFGGHGFGFPRFGHGSFGSIAPMPATEGI